MAIVKRPGWELNDPNTSSTKFKASIPAKIVSGSGSAPGTQSRLAYVNNIETGTFDVYAPNGFGAFGSPIATYSPTDDKLIPLDQTRFNSFFDPNTAEGRVQLNSVVKGGKEATFDLAQLNATNDPTSIRNFEEIKNKPGYKSLANKSQGGQRAAPPETPNSGNPNNPNPNPDSETPPEGANKEEFNVLKGQLSKDFVEGTRKQYYGDVKYPEKLSLKNQDCIKFTILEYKPRTLSLGLDQKRRTSLEGRTSKGTITLPIPAGIGDRNGVSWGEDRMNILAAGAADFALNFMLGGAKSAEGSAQTSMKSVLGADSKDIESFIAAKFTENAVGSNVLARQFGAIVNDNLELLFTSTQLRNFTFNFRFTPREPKEANNVKKIIRWFKQSMAPKRTESVLLLKSPHTFRIQYLSNNQDHPYLNRFKECALTDCAVNYTPDGTYMTYTDSSMTAYELSLTFQELEPVFDDDYGLLDDNTDKFIGY